MGVGVGNERESQAGRQAGRQGGSKGKWGGESDDHEGVCGGDKDLEGFTGGEVQVKGRGRKLSESKKKRRANRSRSQEQVRMDERAVYQHMQITDKLMLVSSFLAPRSSLIASLPPQPLNLPPRCPRQPRHPYP